MLLAVTQPSEQKRQANQTVGAIHERRHTSCLAPASEYSPHCSTAAERKSFSIRMEIAESVG